LREFGYADAKSIIEALLFLWARKSAVVGGIEHAALPTPVSTGSGSKGFSQSLLFGIPLAAVWDYTHRSHDNAAYAECIVVQLSSGRSLYL
jgi:hypothetical protein